MYVTCLAPAASEFVTPSRCLELRKNNDFIVCQSGIFPCVSKCILSLKLSISPGGSSDDSEVTGKPGSLSSLYSPLQKYTVAIQCSVTLKFSKKRSPNCRVLTGPPEALGDTAALWLRAPSFLSAQSQGLRAEAAQCCPQPRRDTEPGITKASAIHQM